MSFNMSGLRELFLLRTQLSKALSQVIVKNFNKRVFPCNTTLVNEVVFNEGVYSSTRFNSSSCTQSECHPIYGDFSELSQEQIYNKLYSHKDLSGSSIVQRAFVYVPASLDINQLDKQLSPPRETTMHSICVTEGRSCSENTVLVPIKKSFYFNCIQNDTNGFATATEMSCDKISFFDDYCKDFQSDFLYVVPGSVDLTDSKSLCRFSHRRHLPDLEENCVWFMPSHAKLAAKDDNLPTVEKLKAIESCVIDMVPKFFHGKSNYGIVHHDVVFVNNLWGQNKVHRGIPSYVMQMSKLRILAHLKYSSLGLSVVSCGCIPDEGRIRIHWRMIGVSLWKSVKFWKFFYERGKLNSDVSDWVEGISNLYVNKEGLIVKHHMDRIVPDEESVASGVAFKLAMLMGVGSPSSVNALG